MIVLEIRAYASRPLTLLSIERFTLPAPPAPRGDYWLTASTGMVHDLHCFVVERDLTKPEKRGHYSRVGIETARALARARCQICGVTI